jgi:hemerythrin-like domain-containing protein
MQLLDSLRGEHVLIERAVGALHTYASRRASGLASAEDGAAFLRFFRLYAGRFHHAREEQVLFPALVERTEAPADRGPLLVLLQAHHAMGRMLDELEPLLQRADLSAGEAERLLALARRYGGALLHHIDAENSVLFTESETRFRRAGIADLPARGPDAEESAARDEGERLCAVHPPSEIPDLLRGDGCTACDAYGAGCDGVEREWWSEHEWEDFFERNS